MKVGYAHLQSSLRLNVFPVESAAVVGTVASVLPLENGEILVPKSVAPETENPVDHLIFALKHEGTNLQVLSEAMIHIDPHILVSRLKDSPSSLYARKAGFLWEIFNQKELEITHAIGGNYGDLFDPEKYVTAPGTKSKKWRIHFNGLGTPQYCPSVRKTPQIISGIHSNILKRTNEYLVQLQSSSMDRALSWAYLSETEKSFEIENESASPNKAEAFVALLKQAHERKALSEDYLSDLQSATITNPFDKAVCFRDQQNWLRKGGIRGANSVSYLPPPPTLCRQLMDGFMAMANHLPQTECDPIVAASLASFGFVYLHPFMDGNGRLSRFLFHHALCLSNQLEKGHLLPVSVAMKHNEEMYLKTLQSFSQHARALWKVKWIDEDQFDFEFKGSDSIYRYWDATACAEFGFKMAEQALEIHLKDEVVFLECFDRVRAAVNSEFDLQDNAMHVLITSALQNGGVVSKNKRKKYDLMVQAAAFDRIEELAKKALALPQEK